MNKAMKSPPLALHEDVIERHFTRDPSTGERVEDHALAALKSAAAFGRETASRIVNAHKTILANEMETPIAREKRARDTEFRLLETITRRIDTAVAVAETERNVLKQRFASPAKAKDLNDATAASDTRLALARMTPSERRKAIHDAIGSGDDLTLSAVLNAPALATGHTVVELEAIRDAWKRQRFPKEVDRDARLERAVSDLTRAGSAMIAFVNTLTDAERIATAEASEKAARFVAP